MVVQSNRTLKSSILSKSPAPLEESEMEMGAEWNKWILRDGVASLYLALVKYLMQSHGDSGYNYWPPYPSENSDVISNIISTEFWNKLVTSQHRLYLPITPKQSPSPVASDAEKPPRLRFSDAVFDLLEPDVSKFVVSLLLRLGVHNIVSPPSNIRRYLIECQAKPMKFLSSSYFLGRLRRHNSKLLQIWKELENDTDLGFFNLVFSFIFKDFFKDNISIPPAGEVKIPDLKGSTLLPLADKNLGKFRPKTSAEADCYLVARTPQERRLLDFVPKISVHPGFDEKVVESLMNGGLNIKYFEFADIPRLYKEINGRRDSKLRIKWLEEMWEYYQKCIYKDPGQEKNCLKILENLEVYFGYRVGQSADDDAVFISPAQFSCGTLAAVLKQQGKDVDPSVSIVLDSLPGLILLDTLAFPEKQLPKELIITFTGALGFNRLLKSIKVLALESQLSIEEYIIKSLKKDGIEALRRLLDPTMMTVLLKEQSTSKGLLEQLPIWPSETGDISSYRTAQKAMLAPNIDIPFDGLPENVVFIQARVAKDYMSQLGKFGVKKMNIDQLLAQNTRQGQSIQGNKIQRYKTFLRNLHQDRPAAFSKHPLAVNGEKKYCMVNSLYCAKDKYFRAAFRDLQKTHFLFPALQDLRLWDQVGLRREKTENNYLECVRSIERRRREEPSLPESGQLVLDAETIYEYLKFDAQDMEKWAPETWNTLSNTPFPVKEQIGPSHRVSQTRLVRGSSYFAEFRRTVIEKYADIAWSQCPVLRITPGSIVLSKISSQGGAPSTTVVLNHLMFLSKNRSNVQKHQISAYIQDVKAAYQYLQGNKTSIIFKDRKAKIWLNIEVEDEPTITLEEFLESWKCSEDLCLNRYTSGKVQPALSFLMPFAGLLEFYGVEKVVPPPPPPGPIEFENRSEILLAAFQRFRREGKFFDIRFEVEGQVLGSHKAILAAASMYFETMFSGPWKESNLDVIQLSNDFKASTVLAVFDYIYSGEIPALDKRAEAEGTYHRLIYQLELSNLWLLEDLKIKLGDQLCCEHIIRLETVTDIRQRAVDYNVPRLLSVCDEYIQNNRKLVERELSCDDSI
ncbi:hypothetical protein DFP73DRAFT_483109 [Morchella snyderi]|nr:hypothetical protein DFP73DRAFT_483109 [Morchella snyderi]